MSGHVLVPAEEAQSLTLRAVREQHVECLDSDLARWDFYSAQQQNTGANCFEWHVWTPDRPTLPKDARTHLASLGYVGDVGAFIAWVAMLAPENGQFASIPNDDACWHFSPMHLCAPTYRTHLGNHLYRILRLDWIGAVREVGTSFIGFRRYRELRI